MALTRLRSIRERKGFTQAELAKAAGVSKLTILRAEQGEDVYPSTLRKIAGALGLEPEQLAGDAE